MTQKNHNKDSIKHQSPHNQEIKLLGDSPDLINISDTYNSIAYPQRDRFSRRTIITNKPPETTSSPDKPNPTFTDELLTKDDTGIVGLRSLIPKELK